MEILIITSNRYWYPGMMREPLNHVRLKGHRSFLLLLHNIDVLQVVPFGVSIQSILVQLWLKRQFPGYIYQQEAMRSARKMDTSACFRPMHQHASNDGPEDAETADIEAAANSLFQKMYASEMGIQCVLDTFKAYKTSGDERESRVFCCMIDNLLDEYVYITTFPEREMRMTGIIYGKLIQEDLIIGITRAIAMRFILESLRNKRGGEEGLKLFRFGMFALVQFKERLNEWPQYFTHLLEIPHLREGYKNLVAEPVRWMREKESKIIGRTVPVSRSHENGDTRNSLSKTDRETDKKMPSNGALECRSIEKSLLETERHL